MKKLEIDLNKLTLDELETLVSIAKKGSQDRKTEIVEEAIVLLPTKQPIRGKYKKRKYKRMPKKYYERLDKTYKPVYDLIQEKGISFKSAYEIVNKKQISGTHYVEYKAYCKKNRLPLMMPRKRNHNLHALKKEYRIAHPESKEQLLEESMESSKRMSDSSKKNYKVNEFFKFRDRHYERISDVLKLGYKEALKLLANNWALAGKDPKKADAYMEQNYKNSFPKVNGIDERYSPILSSMLVKVIKMPETELRKDIEGFTIGIEDTEGWKTFCEAFLLKSNPIARYFAVPNRFKLKGEGKRMVVAYG